MVKCCEVAYTRKRWQNPLVKPLFLALAATLACYSANAVEAQTGSFECKYVGDWHCADNGICIDSVRTNVSRPIIRLNFDKRHISMNGVDGRLEQQNVADGYWIYWQLGGLGLTKLTTDTRDGKLIVRLINERAEGRGSTSSEFWCVRANQTEH